MQTGAQADAAKNDTCSQHSWHAGNYYHTPQSQIQVLAQIKKFIHLPLAGYGRTEWL